MPFSVDLIRRNAARARRSHRFFRTLVVMPTLVCNQLWDRPGVELAIPGKELWGVRGGGATTSEALEELVSARMEMEIETLTKGRGARSPLGTPVLLELHEQLGRISTKRVTYLKARTTEVSELRVARRRTRHGRHVVYTCQRAGVRGSCGQQRRPAVST
jgi:hypothetical protein